MKAARIRNGLMVVGMTGWLSMAADQVQGQGFRAGRFHFQGQGFRAGRFHYNPQPHWGCFGYCNGPLRPHPQYWGCFGYCNGPLNSYPHYWACYGYCPGPLPYASCFGYCPQSVADSVPSPYYVDVPQPPPTVPTPENSGQSPPKQVQNPPSPKQSPTKPTRYLEDWIKQLKEKHSQPRSYAATPLDVIRPDAKESL